MTKVQGEFGSNPFIPGRSSVCRAFETFFIFGVVIAGLGAVVISVARATL